ncbi:MAG: hypothetical protein NDI84_02905 [Steroidobacteraceae bacterium]|nr:hypothetical protein [Steroidobacteraceae bacterium]
MHSDYPNPIRGFVALVREPDGSSYQAVPLVAPDLAEAQCAAGQLAGDVVAVLEQANVTALGMALAMARAVIEEAGTLLA